jgi:D-aminopeptidase
MAAAASRIPGVQRCGAREVLFEAQSAQAAFDVCDIAVVLASGVVLRETV